MTKFSGLNLVDSKYKNWKCLYRKSSWLNGASLAHSYCGIENNFHTLQTPAHLQPRANLKMENQFQFLKTVQFIISKPKPLSPKL